MAEGKSVFLSKTFWTNVITIVGLFTAKHFGFTIDGGLTAQILAGINVVLRFVTKEPVKWKND